MEKKRGKRLSNKDWIRAERRKQSLMGLAIFLSLALLIIIPSTYYAYDIQSNHQSQPKAAIVDQLSLTFPNHTFVEMATSILEQAGYNVDYYQGNKVTVEFYRKLPTYGYKLIILRVHSAGHSILGNVELQLFTSEPYSNKYISEILTGCVGAVVYHSDTVIYFGICPKFVQQSMKDNFRNAIIIMMGCDGLTGTQMAEAFIQKGAKAYIGWKGSVSVSHTDTATITLLQHLVIKNQTIKQAVENTMKEVGPDPTYNSTLTYYPLNAGEQTITP